MKKIEFILLALIIMPLVIFGTNFYNDYIIVFLEKFIPYEPHKYNHESCKN